MKFPNILGRETRESLNQVNCLSENVFNKINIKFIRKVSNSLQRERGGKGCRLLTYQPESCHWSQELCSSTSPKSIDDTSVEGFSGKKKFATKSQGIG